MQVVKDMRVDGLSIYWCPAKPHTSSSPSDSPVSAWLGSMEEGGANKLPPDMHDILPGLFFDMRLTTKYGERPLPSYSNTHQDLAHAAQNNHTSSDKISWAMLNFCLSL